jgi:hypothetical protein
MYQLLEASPWTVNYLHTISNSLFINHLAAWGSAVQLTDSLVKQIINRQINKLLTAESPGFRKPDLLFRT